MAISRSERAIDEQIAKTQEKEGMPITVDSVSKATCATTTSIFYLFHWF